MKENTKNRVIGLFQGALATSIGLFALGVSAAIVTGTGTTGFGTQTNDSTTTGYIGEYLSSQILVASAVSFNSTSAVADSSASAVTVTSVTLGAGDWDVTGVVDIVSSGVTGTDVYSGTSLTSGSLGAQDTTFALPVGFSGVSNTTSLAAPVTRYSLATSTPVYLVGRGLYSAGTQTAYGTIHARRVR